MYRYIENKIALYLSPDKYESISLSVHKKKFNIDIQDGSHLEFPVRMISATSTIHLDTANEV